MMVLKQKFIHRAALTALSLAISLSGLLPASTARASQVFKGKLTSDTYDTFTLAPGEKKSFKLQFRNTGDATWQNSGANFVSIVSVTLPKSGDPVKRVSQFADASWVENFRPVKLLENNVAPGQAGTFNFLVKAPLTEGRYKESFTLVAKNLSWITGASITFDLTVRKGASSQPPANTTTSVPTAQAGKKNYPIRDASYSAAKMIQSDQSLKMVAGEEKDFTVGFKNNSTKTWTNSGSRYVSLYTTDPSYHKSLFHNPSDANWLSDHQIKMTETSVKPGEIGYFKFKIKAPEQTGDFQETFRMTAEEWTWVKDSEVVIPISVQPRPAATQPAGPGTVAPNLPATPVTPSPPADNTVYRDKTYSALKLIQSDSKLELMSGETVTFRVGFKNSGNKVWTSTGSRYVSLYTAGPNYRTSLFAPPVTAASGWVKPNQIKLEAAETKPGEIGFFTFEVRAPSQAGQYTEKFRLAAEEWSWIQGSDLEIPIIVTAAESPTGGDAPATVVAPKTVEPMLRVGLYPTEEEVKISANGPFEVRSGDGVLLETLQSGQVATVTFDLGTKTYKLVTPTINQSYPTYLRFVPASDAVIMQLTNYEKRPSWNLSINYNQFRGAIEIRHNDKKNRVWVINEVSMEKYLAGIAETSPGTPIEYLKSMTVAARTYAFYHYLRQTKHAGEFYTVDAYYDQVYRGYSSEVRFADLQLAVRETKGLVVTYGNEIAITPYFSRSDGRTKNWSDVWGGSVPWCVPVSVPQDAGQNLWGHGVGMSARGALIMARDEGKSMDQILKHFYTGVNVEKWY